MTKKPVFGPNIFITCKKNGGKLGWTLNPLTRLSGSVPAYFYHDFVVEHSAGYPDIG